MFSGEPALIFADGAALILIKHAFRYVRSLLLSNFPVVAWVKALFSSQPDLPLPAGYISTLSVCPVRFAESATGLSILNSDIHAKSIFERLCRNIQTFIRTVLLLSSSYIRILMKILAADSPNSLLSQVRRSSP